MLTKLVIISYTATFDVNLFYGHIRAYINTRNTKITLHLHSNCRIMINKFYCMQDILDIVEYFRENEETH